MSNRKFIIYCDESTDKGRYYSHFYGGALVDASVRQSVEQKLQAVKDAENLGAELKWTKITEVYKGKYLSFLEVFFDLIECGDIKIRLMFTQNSNLALGLEEHQIDNQYWLLYYQLIKHAFGLIYCEAGGAKVRVSVYLDDVPDSREKFNVFKSYVASLSNHPRFVQNKVNIPYEEIVDVNSKNHTIIQGLDIVLGAMQFRLNDMHLAMPHGKKRRSKRTRAKEDVYKYISQRIRNIYPNFNIGFSTSTSGDNSNRWRHSYRHWLFVPSEYRIIPNAGKRRNKKAP